jgi:hypothetical protein
LNEWRAAAAMASHYPIQFAGGRREFAEVRVNKLAPRYNEIATFGSTRTGQPTQYK